MTQSLPVRALLLTISGYKYLLSPLLGDRCRFHPSCSDYCKVAVTEFGVFKGLGLALFRLLRCNPFFKGGFDPVPEEEAEKVALRKDTSHKDTLH